MMNIPKADRNGCRVWKKSNRIFRRYLWEVFIIARLKKLPGHSITLHMSLPGDRIVYAESCHIKEIGISLVHEYIFDRVDEKNCRFKYRMMNAGTAPVSEEISAALNERMRQMAKSFQIT